MDCTFANFVVGSSNQFAHAASVAVARFPAQAYNPLFLYGGGGLGKTHLLQAIGHHITHHGGQAVYLSAERFANELNGSLQRGSTASFRRRYRLVNALLIDDVQCLGRREHIQEEFLHTYDALYLAGNQIVVAGDKAPQEMLLLPERLRSRLASGLIADLQPPDLETRVAILYRKADERGVALPSDVAMLVASQVRTNIRELEGCLTRLGAHASLHGRTITTEFAAEVLRHLLAESEQGVTTSRVQQTVAEYFGLQTDELVSKRRLQSISFPRQIAMFLCRELTDASLPEIGRCFGGRDHSTVLHSCTKIARLEEGNEQIAHLLRQLRRILGG